MTTPALVPDPYDGPVPAAVTDLVGWEAAGWHAPTWWATHWRLTGQLDDVEAHLQEGGREDWLRWSSALGEEPDSPLQHLLRSLGDDEIGFSVVTATKR